MCHALSASRQDIADCRFPIADLISRAVNSDVRFLLMIMKLLATVTLSSLLLIALVRANPTSMHGTAQTFHSGISGRITDPNGAVIVGARITIVSRSSQTNVSSKSNTEGAYTVDLEPDTYDVCVEAWGFKKATRKSIQVAPKSRPYVDFVLEVAPPVTPKLIN